MAIRYRVTCKECDGGGVFRKYENAASCETGHLKHAGRTQVDIEAHIGKTDAEALEKAGL